MMVHASSVLARILLWIVLLLCVNNAAMECYRKKYLESAVLIVPQVQLLSRSRLLPQATQIFLLISHFLIFLFGMKSERTELNNKNHKVLNRLCLQNLLTANCDNLNEKTKANNEYLYVLKLSK